MCNPETGACEGPPTADGVACDDGDACSADDACFEGVCVGGRDLCACDGQPDGAPCDDGDPCTQTDGCEREQCVGRDRLDCSALNDTCSVGICDSELGGCTTTPVLPGTICDDGDPCTLSDGCFEGVCVGEPLSCAELDGECSVGTCEAGACVAEARPDGTTVDDVCDAGVCQGVGFPVCEVEAQVCEPLAGIETLASSAQLEIDGELVVRGRAEISGEQDWYVVELQAGQLFSVITSADCGSALDTFISIRGADGVSVLASNDDTGGRLWAEVRDLEVPLTGLYFVQVRTFLPDGQPSAYLITLSARQPPTCTADVECGCGLLRCDGDEASPGACVPVMAEEEEPNNGPLGATPMAVDTPRAGHLETPGDADWFRVPLQGGIPVDITTGDLCRVPVDTVIRLFGVNGQQELGSNDDLPGTVLSGLMGFTPQADGEYLVQVRGYNGAIGPYRLEVSDARCQEDADCGCEALVCDVQAGRVCLPRRPEVEPNDTLAQATPVELNAPVSGHIDAPREVDIFTVLLAPGTYTIDTHSLCGADGDTTLALVDAQGRPVAADDDGGEGRFARISDVQIETAGRYYIRVGYFGLGQGSYTLDVHP